MNVIKEKDSLKGILIVAAIVITVVGIWWTKVLVTNGKLNWMSREKTYLKEEKDYINQVVKQFLNEIVNPSQPITERELSVFICFNIYITYSIFLYKKVKEKRLIIILISMAIMMILYISSMLLVYLTLFEQYETQLLSSFDRYAATMLLSGFFLNTIILCNEIKFKTYYMSLILTVLLIFLPMKDIYNMYICSREYNVEVDAKRNEYGKIKKYKKLFNENDKIYLVTNKLSDYKFAMSISKYEMMPILIGNEDGTEFKSDLMSELMDNYTYIYCLKENSQFDKLYENAFGEKIKFESDSLYKVNKIENNLRVEKVLLKDIINLMVFE